MQSIVIHDIDIVDIVDIAASSFRMTATKMSSFHYYCMAHSFCKIAVKFDVVKPGPCRVMAACSPQLGGGDSVGVCCPGLSAKVCPYIITTTCLE